MQTDRSSEPPRSAWRTRNVLVLGLVSLLNDSASEMVIPLLPVFLASVGGGALALGWIEGLADLVSSVLKLAAGRWADRAQRYRPFVIAGYALAVIVRPLLAIASSAGHVLAVRIADRTGKGLRTSPRDTLLAASVPRAQRGAAFGFHRAMDHAGAVVGPLMATALLALVTRDLRVIFALAAIPGVLALMALIAGAREVEPAPEPQPATQPPATQADAGEVARSRSELLRFLVPLGLFTIGNASDTFLLLRAGAERAPLETLPLLWVALHVVKSITSMIGGRLSDRWGRRPVIAVGWCVYAAIYVGFAFAEGQLAIWILFAIYGAYHGLSEAAEKALVADLVPKSAWGTGFGRYHLVVGVLSLVASVLFGTLWELVDPRAAFLTSAALALVASMGLMIARRRRTTAARS